MILEEAAIGNLLKVACDNKVVDLNEKIWLREKENWCCKIDMHSWNER